MTTLRHALVVAAALACAGARAGELAPAELARVKAAETARIAAIERVYGAVVAIYGANVARGGGSGVLFDADGFALTNYHVVRAAGRQGKAGLADGKLYDWRLYGIDPGGDLAVIRLAGKDAFPTAELGDSRTVRVGDWAMAMGNPFNLAEDQKPTVTLGIVSGIERFQPGQGGGRTLVYGNCIQIDSSINPGNSGGPLFDMAGRLIGINGRGSFEERGRVNVGLGYAVSVEQARNFLPDLLATKTCEHATLDATFYDHEGKVLCDRVNDNAAIAQLGLRPGDPLIAFDGTPIRSANQYLNLVSTYPAEWPVSVTFCRGDEERTVWVRLRALPYGPQPQPRQPRVIPRKADEPKEKEKGKDAPKQPERPAPPPPMIPGKIADKKVNREACNWLASRCRACLAAEPAAEAPTAIEWEEAVLEDGKAVGRQRVVLAADGRFRVDVAEGYDGAPKGTAWGFDGKQPWRLEPGQAEAAEVKPEPLESAAWRALAALRGNEPFKLFKEAELEGGDRAQGQRAFRLRLEDGSGGKLLVWLALFGPDGRIAPVPLKAARDSSQKGEDAAVTFSDYRPVGGVRTPHCRRWVQGLEERAVREFTIASAKPLDRVPDGAFAPPKAGK